MIRPNPPKLRCLHTYNVRVTLLSWSHFVESAQPAEASRHQLARMDVYKTQGVYQTTPAPGLCVIERYKSNTLSVDPPMSTHLLKVSLARNKGIMDRFGVQLCPYDGPSRE